MPESNYDFLLRTLREKRESTVAHMAMGTCKTYEEYKSLCGVVRGIDFAEQEIMNLAKQLEKDDE